MTEIEIRELPLDDRAGHEAYAAVWNSVMLREPITAAELSRNRARKADDVRFVARLDWQIAGCASAVRSDLAGRTYTALAVLPEHRRHGVGRALLARALETARRHGSSLLATAFEEGDREGEAFAAALGFEEVFREVEISRRLRGDEADPESPAGIEIAPLAERADAIAGAYELACLALPELPLPTPIEVPDLERWLDEEATGPGVLAGGTLVALEDGRVVGFASLLRREADPRLAEHGLTAVAPSHRRRGIATALKRRQIAWAARNGYRELMTFTQEGNAGMQAVNMRLGYVPRPAWIRIEAPLDRVAERLRG
ncbi:MAG TPA: GNAT family N-acetyltransferase [Gaiellaceae bacterium]|nr:GNAT family N-acetyltransferase [Gaiellaceae bacterium]